MMGICVYSGTVYVHLESVFMMGRCAYDGKVCTGEKVCVQWECVRPLY